MRIAKSTGIFFPSLFGHNLILLTNHFWNYFWDCYILEVLSWDGYAPQWFFKIVLFARSALC